MAKHDYIPGPDTRFDAFQRQLVKKAGAKLAQWGIPPFDYNALLPLQTKWANAWNKASNKGMRSRTDVLRKKTARKAYQKAIRAFVRQWLTFNSKLNSGDLKGLSLTVRDNILTEIAAPDSRPIFFIRVVGGGWHHIVFRDSETTTSRGKPPGIVFMDIRWKYGDERPRNADDFDGYDTPTRSPFRLDHGRARLGQRVHYSARWVARRNKKGRWSQVKSVVIG